MQISVIIPVYNAERHIRKAVLSVVNQKFVEEVVMVNDNSSDHSVEIINELIKEFPKIKLIEHDAPTNIGAGKSRNLGIKSATFDWFAFLDVDDYYYDNRFIKTVEVINEHHDADGVYEAVENVFENENAKHKYIASRPDKKNFLYTMEEVIAPEDLFKVLMAGDRGFFHLNGVLIKKESFEKIGYFKEDLELSQDTDALFKIAMTDKLYPGSIDKPVAARLVHDTNRMFANSEKLNFFRAKKYFDFIEFAKAKQMNASVRQIIEEKNIKLCAADILGWNIYRLYRVKYFILKLIYPAVIKKYLKKQGAKYLKH